MCEKATWRGQTVCAHSVPKYEAWAVAVGQPVKLVAIHGSYSNLAASAGTDSQGGHLDIEMDGYSPELQRQTETDGRSVMLAACLRLWAGNNHVHTLDPECTDLSPQACAQFEDFRKGLDGLVDNAPLGGDKTHMAAILSLYDHRFDAKTPPPPPAPAPAPRPLPWKGADVSRYTSIDTITADAKALDFELVMCTEGKGYKDATYPQEIALVRAGTAMSGAVHYAWPENGWQADYANFKSYAGLRAGEAGALDFEPWHTSQPNADPATFPEYVVGWANQFKADFGVDPLFYAPDYFVNQIKAHATADQWARISELPFWKAGVNGAYVASPSGGPGDALGFKKVAAWQWSDKPLDQDLLFVPWSSIAVTVGGSSTPAKPVVYVKPPVPVASHATSYIVQSGDTLTSIGAKYHVTVAQLASWNHITNVNVIHVGQHLTLVPPHAAPGVVGGVHIVQSGETLSGIAAKYHVTVAQLATWNHIANVNLIRVGQRLLVRGSAPAPAAAPAAHRFYTVQKGDSLSAIASKFHTSVAQLVSWNGVKDPNLIYPGQRFRVG